MSFTENPIFHHNAIDILSLACLMAIVPFALGSPETAALRHGTDFVGLARWLDRSGRDDEAVRLLRRAVEMGLPDALLFRTLWDIAGMEKEAGPRGCRAGRGDGTGGHTQSLSRARPGSAGQALRASRTQLRDGPGNDSHCARTGRQPGHPPPRTAAESAVPTAVAASAIAMTGRATNEKNNGHE